MVRAPQSQVQAIVEHPFHVSKNLFGYLRVCYRGIAENWARAMEHAVDVHSFC